MTTDAKRRLEQRVRHAAELALQDNKYVAPIDVLVGIGWLQQTHLDHWRQGRTDYLERVVQANLSKISDAMAAFRRWARDRGLKPSETAYVARTRDRRTLRFSKSGKPAIEQAYRTHWVSSELPEAKRERLAQRQSKPPDLVVISPLKEWTCTECAESGRGLLFMEDPGPLCMECADLDHLVFLGSGSAALTRRAKRYSKLVAVVVRFSRARKRYERQGILVEEAALERAETECLADEEARERRRERDQERRADADEAFYGDLAAAVVQQYPGCPPPRADAIARHAAVRGSGRIGRTAAGRALDPHAVALAVEASVRHEDTGYDELLMSGVPRAEARQLVRADVDALLDTWREPSPPFPK